MNPTVSIEPRWAGVQEVVRMAAPIALGSFSVVLMMLTDTYFVSRLGEAPLAAVSSAGVWSYTIASFVIGIVACVSTFVSQSLGRQQFEDCARYTWQGIYVAIASVVVAIAFWPLSGPLFALMNHSPDVVENELIYFQIRLFGFVPMVGMMALSGFFQAVNRPNIPTAVSMLAVVLNAFFDYALIFGKFGFPALGIGGAAWATVLCLSIQTAILMCIFLGKEFNEEYKTRAAYRLDFAKMGELVRIGVPSGVTSVLDVAVWAVFISFVVGSFGAAAMAANSVALNIMHVSLMPALALNFAIAPIVGQWIGRGDHDRAEKRAYTATKIAAVYMIIAGIIFALLSRQVIAIFSDDPAVIDLGQKLLILAAIFQAFDALNIVLSGALRGAGDTKWMAYLISGWAYCVFLPSAWSLAMYTNLGAIGAWIGATIYIISLSGFMLWRFKGGRWKKINIFTADANADSEKPRAAVTSPAESAAGSG